MMKYLHFFSYEYHLCGARQSRSSGDDLLIHSGDSQSEDGARPRWLRYQSLI